MNGFRDYTIERLNKHQALDHFDDTDLCPTCIELRHLIWWSGQEWETVVYRCECGSETTPKRQATNFSTTVSCPQCSKRMSKVIVGG